MREIKFRAWDTKPRPMMISPDSVMDFPTYYFSKGNSNVTLMQYTGLKDKNGLTEIYEGDIIDGTLGIVKGNIYESPKAKVYKSSQFAELGFDFVVEGMGTSAWRDTEQALLECGCKYTE